MALDGKKVKPRRIFLGFLLFLLLVSASLTLFVFKNADNIILAPGQKERLQAAQQRDNEERPDTASGKKGETGPGWRGVVNVGKQEKAGYEIVITPVDVRTGNVPLTSFQVYLRGMKGEKEEDITGLFAKDERGNLKASLEGKPSGPYLLRVRLHRELSTLEFTQRIDLP